MALLGAVGAPMVLAQEDGSALLSLSLEDLMQIEVTSISRRGQALSDTAAAVYVITAEDIANSTAVTIPDLLRAVPGMEVAQLDANKWAVSARGFNSRLVAKLLVVIDGRTVYSPTFGAVLWEHQDLVLENIERIEVIRGPGATIWGANAVNGVVSITTKSAHHTQGSFASMSVGNQYEQIVSVQNGGELTPDASYRIYGKTKQHDGFDSIIGGPAGDDWDSRQMGFRIDAQVGAHNALTLQGDHVDQAINQIQSYLIRPGSVMQNIPNPVDYSGTNIVGRWEHSNEDGGKLTTQFYYDYGRRQEFFQDDRTKTYDLDFTYTNPGNKRHRLTLGGGIRITDHDTTDTPFLSHLPEDETLKLYNISLYDDISLNDKTILGLGLKIENNIYTGTEYQPSVRINYSIADNQNVWAALSRAVRTPSRGERDGISTLGYVPAMVNPILPVDAYATLIPNDDFDVEQQDSLEVGWRWSPNNDLTFDIAAYYNQYDELRALEINEAPYCVPDPFCMGQIDYLLIQHEVINRDEADTYGLEAVAKWQQSERLSFELGYSYFEIDYRGGFIPFAPDSAEASNPERDKPIYKYNLQSNWQINERMRVNLLYRYVSEPGVSSIDDYNAADLQFVWEPSDVFSLRLVGRNLDGGDHYEFGSDLLYSLPANIEKSVFMEARLNW